MIRSRLPRSALSWRRRWILLGLGLALASCHRSVDGLHTIAPGGQIIYEYTLARGEYLRALAIPRDVDLAITLWGPRHLARQTDDSCPDGSQSRTAGQPQDLCSDGSEVRGPYAREELALIADTPGVYRLEIRSTSTDAGTFALKVWSARPPEDIDRDRRLALEIHRRAEAVIRKHQAANVEDLQRGRSLWSKLGDPDREADLLYDIGVHYAAAARLNLAEEAFEQAKVLYRKAGSLEGLGHVTNFSAALAERSGRSLVARQGYQEAIDIFHRIGDRKFEGVARSNLGNVCIDLGDVHAAIENLNQARRIFEDPRVAPLQVDGNLTKTLTILGAAYDANDEREEAREAYERAVELAQRSQDPETLALAHNSLGVYFQSLGEWNQAIANYHDALEALNKWQAPAWRARTLNNLGRTFFRAGRGAEAQRAFAAALDELAKIARTEARDREAEAYVFTNLAYLFLKDGQVEKASGLIARARGITGQNDQLEAASLAVEGATDRALKRYRRARQVLDRGLVLGRKLDSAQHQSAMLFELARLDRDEGDLRSALARIRVALDLVESARSQILNRDQRSTLLASRKDFYDFYIDLLAQLDRAEPGAGYGRQALEVSERAHARSLLEALGEVSRDLRATAFPAVRLLLAQAQGAELRFSSLRQKRARATEVQAAEAELKAKLERLSRVEDKLRLSNPHYADLMQPAPFTAPEIEELVAPGGSLLLEYWLGDEHSFLWAVSAQGVELFDIPQSRRAIERQAASFYRALAPEAVEPPEARRRREAELRHSGRWLSQTLLGPARAALLDGRPLLIVADGALHYIPFSALPDPNAPATLESSRLLHRHQLVNLPSASVLGMLRRETGATPPLAAAIFADPVFRRDDGRVPARFRGQPESPDPEEARRETVSAYSRLRQTGEEAEVISQLLGADKCKIFRNFDASVANVKGIDLSRFRVVHFATHGDINSETPELSALVLSMVDAHGQPQKGYLRLRDIYDLKLHADLVVLSACKTALGRDIGGEGLVGLTRGFMYAGAKRVLASLWSVDSAATRELMKRLYHHMAQEGLSPAQALQAAQIEMSRDRTWSNPYYWAGFTLQGEWR